jgi:hypothetical protein
MNTRLISIQKTPAIYFGNKQSSLKPLVAEVIKLAEPVHLALRADIYFLLNKRSEGNAFTYHRDGSITITLETPVKTQIRVDAEGEVSQNPEQVQRFGFKALDVKQARQYAQEYLQMIIQNKEHLSGGDYLGS